MGTERNADYYDDRLGRAKYQQHYLLSPYLMLWRFVYIRGVGRLREPKVLDLGCGPGQFAAMLRELGVLKYRGIDFSKTAVESGRRVCPEYEFQQRDLRTLRPDDFAGFNVVTCLETLEHIEDDIAVLERVPVGARVVLSVPKHDSESHVRYFPQRHQVVDRYGPLVGSSKLYGAASRWWVLVGKRR